MGCDSTSPSLLSCFGVSIHAPAWGATAGSFYYFHAFPCFNPRTRMGCDSRVSLLYRGIRCFNPRTRMGCDKFRLVKEEQPLTFQSTHPHGVRPLGKKGNNGNRRVSIHAPAWGATVTEDDVVGCQRRFNPRTRMGCDRLLPLFPFFPREVSIHAPAWGAT